MRSLRPLPGQTARSFARKINATLPTQIYRAYDTDGVLLYIGCTDNFKRRLTTHRSGRNATSRTLVALSATFELDADVYPNRDAGERAEAEAIANEKPLLNLQQSGRPRWIRNYDIANYLTARGLPIEVAGLHRCTKCDTLRGTNMAKGLCTDCADEIAEAGAA